MSYDFFIVKANFQILINIFSKAEINHSVTAFMTQYIFLHSLVYKMNIEINLFHPHMYVRA